MEEEEGVEVNGDAAVEEEEELDRGVPEERGEGEKVEAGKEEGADAGAGAVTCDPNPSAILGFAAILAFNLASAANRFCSARLNPLTFALPCVALDACEAGATPASACDRDRGGDGDGVQSEEAVAFAAVACDACTGTDCVFSVLE